MDPHPQALHPQAPTSPRDPRPTASAAAPPARVRGLALVLLSALVLLAVLAPLSAPSAHAAPPATVGIDDEQGVIDDPDALEERLRAIDLHDGAAPVDLEVVTLDISAQDADPDSDTGLNDAVLEYARAEHPDWIDGKTWADGVVILAIDPEHRKLGTYAGEDVKLSDGGFEDVQDAMRDDAADGAWADAFDQGAQKYADLLGRPWWRSPGAIIGAFLALIALGAGAVAALARGAGNRRRVRSARERFDDVRAKRQETDQAASRIPRDSSYGATILADVEDYRRAVDDAEGTASELPAPPPPRARCGASARPRRAGRGRSRRPSRRRTGPTTPSSAPPGSSAARETSGVHGMRSAGRWTSRWPRSSRPSRRSSTAPTPTMPLLTSSRAPMRDRTRLPACGPRPSRSRATSRRSPLPTSTGPSARTTRWRGSTSSPSSCPWRASACATRRSAPARRTTRRPR